MCSPAMTGGAASVGAGLGGGIGSAMTGMQIAGQDIKQGAAPMADPRIQQIYKAMTPMPGALPGRRPGPTA
jgi:hypothetical protein